LSPDATRVALAMFFVEVKQANTANFGVRTTSKHYPELSIYSALATAIK
jgi:hypothetical protein